MNEQQNQWADATDCQVAQALEELGGRVEAPERLEEILSRVAQVELRPVAAEKSGGRWWVAALVLLGLGTTIAAALLRGGDVPRDDVRRDDVRRDDVQKENTEPMAHAPHEPSGASSIGVGQPSEVLQPKQVAAKDAEQLPKGTDPADLAAMRSAEQMLAAEKKLQAMIADGKIAGVDQVLPFEQLTAWPYTDGLNGMPDDVRQLDGKKVLMLGFMLPIDEVQNIREFLLVESLWSCCYGEPPNIHGLVRCTMPKDQRIDYQFEPLKIVGTLRVAATQEDGYVVDIYQLQVDYVEVVR